MSQQDQGIKSISLKSSAELVIQYLRYALNYIIYQRELAPSNSFEVDKEYGLSLMRCTDEKIARYIASSLKHAENYINQRGLNELNFVIFNKGSMEVCEKWVFQIEYESENTISKTNRTNIQAEIRAVLRQIITSINFLPIIDSSHKFKIVFRPSSIQVVAQFPFEIFPYSLTILQSEELSFRKMSTSFHTVETKVVYKRLANN
ncbi:hypothetical protein TSAR_011304 [Trichomalopsis sarcophagae]|uniref:HORMA domain-containing protein n=1 Tax=Trichomalopsis sarcophagae TaxID=543379 RepID=A0A232EF02_9HYME|nr:hypothetical protein TSAR_011304 [Trichomalopsis sarcophagae]